MASVRNKSIIPPEGFRYTVAGTDYTVTAPSYSTLIASVARHCESNTIAAPSVEEIEQYLCDNTTIRCTENGALYQNRWANKRNWPIFLRPMSLLAQTGDAGLGDIVARMVGPIGGDSYKAWAGKTFGGCGCWERQQDLNTLYPL